MANPRRSIITPEFTAARVALKEPRVGKPGWAPKYGISGAWTPADAADIIKAVQELLVEGFPDRQAMPNNPNVMFVLEGANMSAIKLPIGSGDAYNAARVAAGKKPIGDLVGKCMLTMSSSDVAPVQNADGSWNDARDVKNGDTCRAAITLVAMRTGAFTGIAVYLNAVLLVSRGAGGFGRDADPFSAFVSATPQAFNPFAPTPAPVAAPIQSTPASFPAAGLPW